MSQKNIPEKTGRMTDPHDALFAAALSRKKPGFWRGPALICG